MKATYKITDNTRYDNVHSKDFDIVVSGEVVGEISADVRDLTKGRTAPGYRVVVIATVGSVQVYHRCTGAFENRSAKEANANRAEYVRAAKQAVEKYLASH